MRAWDVEVILSMAWFYALAISLLVYAFPYENLARGPLWQVGDFSILMESLFSLQKAKRPICELPRKPLTPGLPERGNISGRRCAFWRAGLKGEIPGMRR
jgi:hypothetical protein